MNRFIDSSHRFLYLNSFLMDLEWSSPRGVWPPVGAIAIRGHKQQFEALLYRGERADLRFGNPRPGTFGQLGVKVNGREIDCE